MSQPEQTKWRKAYWHPEQSRQIMARIIIEGDLVLQSPAYFGSGDQDDLSDMPLLTDLGDGKTPLLPGASIAGALRSYLRAREQGYLTAVPNRDNTEDEAALQRARQREWDSLERQLFGGFGEKEAEAGGEREQMSEQSSLIVEEAYGRDHRIERRYGVKLEKHTRTAEDQKLFDTQLWAAGTTFPLRFELIIRDGDGDRADDLKQSLAAALTGLSDGSITLGGRKRRGYGQAQVLAWRVKSYDLRHDLVAYLEDGAKSLQELGVTAVSDLHTALGVKPWQSDNRHTFHLHATFILDGSLLIRSEGSSHDVADFVHLQARQANGATAPILSGTSLAGALRARALKIANTLDKSGQAKTLVYNLFGPDMEDKEWARAQGQEKVKPQASRLIVTETEIQQGVTNLVQNRVSIDRFTGGARDTALFNEQPVWGKPETTITIDLRLINPTDTDIGLLLLLLKDLWTGDLPLGGESSVGRGRLKGQKAALTLGETVWEMVEDNGRLQFSGNGSQEALQNKYLAAFLEVMGHGS